MSKILVTGAAGFIGFHLSKKLLSEGHEIIGIDNLNEYYDPDLKKNRLDILFKNEGFRFNRTGIEEEGYIKVHETEKPEYIVNLAAQAGVRYSLENPCSYIKSNIDGFMNILECSRKNPPTHLVYASSSSVYGANTKQPFSESVKVDHPVSVYAATKKSNELMAHVYSHLFRIPTTGLRFFTVYGPWGRPDMALFSFTKAILEGRKIDVYNYGKMKRDFTYIDDIVEGVKRVIFSNPEPVDGNFEDMPDRSSAPFRVYNIGNSRPETLEYFIECVENALGKKADKNYMPIQPGDVPETYADMEKLENDFGFRPETPLAEGVKKFVKWYLEYYKIK